MNTRSHTSKSQDGDHAPLVTQFQDAGFKDAFGILWLYHLKRLGRFVRGRGLQEDVAEDLLQEIGLKLFRYLSGHVVEVFPASAFKITKDQVSDFYRALQRHPKLETLDDLIAMNIEPAAAPTNERMKHWSAVQREMDTCGVSRDQQTAVILHHLIGYSLAEVAQITDSNREAVKSRLRYASLKMGRAQKQQGVK